MMQQWYDCKASAKGALLLFRMGDFYEAFFHDAEILAEKGGINLTKRSEIPMSGIPHHQLETYLNKLTKERLHIAIAEQMGDPKAKGLVERRITRTITPGTVVSPHSLEEKNFNTIAALCVSDGLFGLAYCDITTADLHLFEIDEIKVVLTEIARLGVVELLTPPKFFATYPDAWEQLAHESTLSLTDNDKSLFTLSAASEMLQRHFGALTLDSFGAKHMSAAISSAGALLTFTRHKLGNSLRHIQRLLHTPPTDFMAIDRVTEKNLELFESASSGKTDTSLFNLLDQTATPMGGRSLRRWMMRPLIVLKDIEERQEAVAHLFADTPAARSTHAHLKNVRDLERLTTRISSGFATPKDLLALGRSLTHINPAKSCIAHLKSPLIDLACEALGNDSDSIADQINQALTDDPPWRLSDGGVIRSGYNKELDELRASRDNTSEWLTNYQEKIREESGIKNLKVAFNRVAGYYIEVSRAQSSLMPEGFRRTQTLTNNERFTAPERITPPSLRRQGGSSVSA
jgi:DNA mismatch repair protein MutS